MKAGDVVTLKSGSPHMTIQFKRSDGAFQCSWFLNGEFKEGHFVEESLQVVSE